MPAGDAAHERLPRSLATHPAKPKIDKPMDNGRQRP
jgi:hypothetical protein